MATTTNGRASFVLRLPPELADELSAHAADVGVSRNNLIADVLASWLGGEHSKADAERIADAARDAILAAMGVAQ